MISPRPMIVDRRASKFTEVLSLAMVRVAAIGAFVVLVDIKFTFVIYEQVITIGSGFSPDLKGAVIASILISGYTAVKEYWLGSSASGQNQSESMSRIAEASAPMAAAVVAAATAVPPAAAQNSEVRVDATGASTSVDKPPESTKGPTT